MVLFSPILGFPGDSVAESPPTLQEVQVQFLHQENPVEKEIVTDSSMLAYWDGRAWWATVHGVAKSWT